MAIVNTQEIKSLFSLNDIVLATMVILIVGVISGIAFHAPVFTDSN